MTWADFKAALGDPAPYYVGGDTAPGHRYVVAPVTSPVSIAGGELTGGGGFTLDQMLAYARCPMEYVLHYRANVQVLPTSEDIIQHTVREALRDFHAGAKPTPFVAIRVSWRAMLDEWGVEKGDEAYAALEDYARLRTELLLPFLKGEIVKPDGSLYDEPRKAQVYKNMAQARGLLQLQARVDEAAFSPLVPHPPVSLRGDESLAGIFADSLEMILHYSEPEVGEIIGVQVPFSVSLPNELRLSGQADLVARVQERGRAGVVAVVYDFSGRSASWEVLRHDLRVVALLNAGDHIWQCPSPAGRGPATVEQGEPWRSVKVHYLRTGEAVSVYGTSKPAWGRALLAAAARALSMPGIPRMAIFPKHCNRCRYVEVCTSADGWNVLNCVLPGGRPGEPELRKSIRDG